MTQHITLEGVKAACRKAYEEDRLLAQSSGPGEYGYRMLDDDGKERCCAIGAALTLETLDSIEEANCQTHTIKHPQGMIADHSLRNHFSWDREEDSDLRDIQQAHDNWMGRVSIDIADGVMAEQFFKGLIYT